MSGTPAAPDVLLVEDNPGDARLVEHHLHAPHVTDIAGDISLTHEETLPDGLRELTDASYDVLFLDLGLVETTGLRTLERVLEAEPLIPIIVLTGLNDRETAVSAIKRGAQDYLLKDDLDADMLARALRYAIERHQKEEALRRQNEHLDEFASVVSHDLRNPLNVATGRLALAREESSDEHLDAVAQALDRMEHLIEDLLTLAQQGKTVADLESVDLAALGEACWGTIDTGNADLVVEADDAVLADESRLKQLLENLVRNAVDHGGDDVTITLGSLDDGFFVEDDGAGIPEADHAKIFDTGYSTATDGTGFGLMIVEEIADAHDWSVRVTDGEPGGARFEITGVHTL
jgi:signal transduction histidine kinase